MSWRTEQGRAGDRGSGKKKNKPGFLLGRLVLRRWGLCETQKRVFGGWKLVLMTLGKSLLKQSSVGTRCGRVNRSPLGPPFFGSRILSELLKRGT